MIYQRCQFSGRITRSRETGQADRCLLVAVAASKVGNPPVVVVPEVARTAAAHVANIGGVFGLKVPGGTQSQSQKSAVDIQQRNRIFWTFVAS